MRYNIFLVDDVKNNFLLSCWLFRQYCKIQYLDVTINQIMETTM